VNVGEQREIAMPKSAHYTVSWSPERAEYMITGPELVEPARFSLTWLGEHRAFAFHGRQGQINLLKEKRRRGGEGYWYAYRRVRGQMLKRYVGCDEQVSLEQLEELSALLAREAAPENKTMNARALLRQQVGIADVQFSAPDTLPSADHIQIRVQPGG